MLVQISSPAAARNRYGFGPIASKKRIEEPAIIEAEFEEIDGPKISEVDVPKRPVIKHGDYSIFECPVPCLVDNLMTEEDRLANFLINMVNWSEAVHQLPAEGPLLDQSALFYEARLIVLNEQNKIEKERQEIQAAKNKTPQGKNKPRALGKGK